MKLTTNQACAAQHFGLWAVEPLWFASTVNAIKGGYYKMPERVAAGVESAAMDWLAMGPGEGGNLGFVTHKHIAIVPIAGHMTKGDSSFGGTSTIATRQAIRSALADESIRGIMLHIDSPGGTVAGTHELAEQVVAAGVVKPIRAHIQDLGASAAFWVAAGASVITANAPSEVGSIGAVAALLDSSKAMEAEGLEVIVFATGPLKGAGMDGTKVTAEQRAHFQERVINAFEHFRVAVAVGRGLSDKQMEAVTTGGVFSAANAQGLGLIDGVMSFEDAIEGMAGDVDATPRMDRADRQIRLA